MQLWVKSHINLCGCSKKREGGGGDSDVPPTGLQYKTNAENTHTHVEKGSLPCGRQHFFALFWDSKMFARARW